MKKHSVWMDWRPTRVVCTALLLTACGGGDATSATESGSETLGTTQTGEPTEATETSAGPGGSVGETDSTGSEAGTDTMNPTDPTEATDSTDPTDPTESTDTTDPTETTETTETTGEPCPAGCEEEMGGVCVGSECCDPEQVCLDVCCGDGDVCSFGICQTPGEVCLDSNECGDDEYCDYSLGDPEMEGMGMCAGGFEPATGKCLPKPDECLPGEEPMEGEPITCIAKCEFIPDGSFNPEVKYHWNTGHVMMAPIVIQLDDDNCDGVVNEKDIPEILFHEFQSNQYNVNGTLHAVSVVEGELVTKWSAHFDTDRFHPGREIAAGNIDGNPGNEIIACTENGKVRALDAEGNALWTTDTTGTCIQPSIADLEGDGFPEVIVSTRVLDGMTGAVKFNFDYAGPATAADLTGDGKLEIVNARYAFNTNGEQIAFTGIEGLHAAVADLDLDGNPEVAVIANSGQQLPHHLVVWRYDPDQPNGVEIIRGGIDINGPLSPGLCPNGSAGNTRGGGPPTIADFNGDGTPDVAVAGGIGYAVFDGTQLMDPNVANSETMLWIKQTKDCSSAQTGSSVFDFDGDGSAEVVYSDEHYLRIYQGSTGDVLWQTCNTTGTLREYPLVADVDNDGQADIVAVSNDYSSITCDGTKQTGVRIFGDSQGQWVRTRRIWNQHSYHVTNNMSVTQKRPARLNLRYCVF